MKCEYRKKDSVLYESGDYSNKGFSSQPPIIMFSYGDLREEKTIKRMRHVHRIGKKEHVGI